MREANVRIFIIMKILIVAPYFYPDADVSSVRINSLCTYLLKQGVEVSVIRDKEYENAFEYDNSHILASVETFLVDTKGSRKYTVLKNLYTEKFKQTMDSGSYDLVLITMGPFSTLPLCELCKEIYSVPCILDYRDLWIFDMRRKRDFFKPRMLYRKFRAFPIEKKNICCASRVVTVTEEWKGILRKVYKGDTDKFWCIPNGYDDELLNAPQNADVTCPAGEFVISVFGKFAFYSPEYAIAVFKAIEQCASGHTKVVINHIGNSEAAIERIFEKKGQYKIFYHNTGFVEYAQGIQMLKASDAVLLVDIRNGAMGTKFYDYVFANKPIIYVGKPNTQLAKLVSEFDGGFVCQDARDVYGAINSIIDNRIDCLTQKGIIGEYARSMQNKKYLNLMYELVK